jgi:ABC-type Fe3+ transport system permease subunit
MLLAAAAWVVLLLIFWTMQAKGHTPGSAVSGFRFLTWKYRIPGAKYGLALVLVRVVAPPLWVAVAVIMSVPGDGPLPGLEGFPFIGERTHRRRFLEAADDHWERWS